MNDPMIQHENNIMPTAVWYNAGAQTQSGFTLPCDFSDCYLNLPFSSPRTASVVPVFCGTQRKRDRARKEEKELLAKYKIERMKVTYVQVVQDKLVKS